MKWIFLFIINISLFISLFSLLTWPLILPNTQWNVGETQQSKRFAVFACSIHSTKLVYTFYAPILVASWRRIGYESIVYFVGDFQHPNATNRRLNLTRTYLKDLGAQIIDVQCDEKYSVKISQMIRVFSGFLPNSIVKDEDQIITTDSDLMPLQSKNYELSSKRYIGFIYNSRCCGSFQRRNRTYRMFPMGHIYLPKKIWRSIILESDQRKELIEKNSSDPNLLNESSTLSFELLQLYGRHEFSSIFDRPMIKGDASWYMDQTLCSMLINDYRRKFSNFTLDERGMGRRLDRSASISHWNRDRFDQYVDAHLIHDEIFREANWKIFNKLLRYLFNETLVERFNDYYRQYYFL